MRNPHTESEVDQGSAVHSSSAELCYGTQVAGHMVLSIKELIKVLLICTFSDINHNQNKERSDFQPEC
jgi:hypothetical protein